MKILAENWQQITNQKTVNREFGTKFGSYPEFRFKARGISFPVLI